MYLKYFFKYFKMSDISNSKDPFTPHHNYYDNSTEKQYHLNHFQNNFFLADKR